MQNKKRIILLCVLIVSSLPASLFAQGLEYVPVDDPVYAFLEYARVQGAIAYLPQVRPYLESDVIGWLETITSGAKKDLSDRSAAYLERLNNGRRRIGGLRFGDDGVISLDASVDLTADAALSRPGDTIPMLTIPFSLGFGLGTTVFLSLDVEPAFAYWGWEERPEKRYDPAQLWDYYNFLFPLDGRTGSFGHSGYHEPGTQEIRILFNTLNQFTLDLNYLKLQAGRGALDWGPSERSNLVLSKDAKPYNYIGFDMPLGDSGMFSWMTGILQDFAYEGGDLDQRLITAHRVEYQLTDWLNFALYESVLYDYVFELAFLNPLSFYYITEVTQGSGDSNKLGGADLVVTLPNLRLYGSLFADDWDAGHMFEFNSSHNEFAGILGADYYDLVPNLALNLELVYLSHWMYTHATWTSPTSVGKSYQHYGSHLGHFLDQNSWMAALAGKYELGTASWIMLEGLFIQDGRGDIDTPPDWAAETALHGETDYRDIHYTFLDWGKPGFTVDTTIDISLSGSHEFPSIGLEIGGRYSLQYHLSQDTETREIIDGSRGFEHYLTLEASFSPGFAFR